MELKKATIPVLMTEFQISTASVTVSDKQPDLLYIDFILCHEFGNANGDYFTKDILKANAKTPIFKPIDWEHTYPCIGVITASEFVDGGASPSYIKCSGVVWKYFFPEQSQKIEQHYASGKLKVSMECYFRDCDYLVGDRVYSEEEAARLHIADLRGLGYKGNAVYRRFVDAIFGGVGVVSNPADKEAVILSVASQVESLKRYHDLLHFWYETEGVESPLADLEIEAEHRKIHDMLTKFGDCV